MAFARERAYRLNLLHVLVCIEESWRRRQSPVDGQDIDRQPEQSEIGDVKSLMVVLVRLLTMIMEWCLRRFSCVGILSGLLIRPICRQGSRQAERGHKFPVARVLENGSACQTRIKLPRAPFQEQAYNVPTAIQRLAFKFFEGLVTDSYSVRNFTTFFSTQIVE